MQQALWSTLIQHTKKSNIYKDNMYNLKQPHTFPKSLEENWSSEKKQEKTSR